MNAACAVFFLFFASAPALGQTGAAQDSLSAATPTTPAPAQSKLLHKRPSAVTQSSPATVTKTPAISSATLPRNLDPWGMFMEADWVVKTVIIGLVIASIVTWTLCVVKSLELNAGKHRLQAVLDDLWETRALTEAIEHLQHTRGIADWFAGAIERELYFSADFPPDGIKERLALQLGRVEAAASRHMTRGTGLLATIGSTAPFVGLFGTVWGIMNSFIGISEAQTTNLAVVAPGIAEALLVTAIGLVTAIPAVVIYNLLARSTAGYRALLADTVSEVMQLLSRDLDQKPQAEQQRLRRAAE